jgi:ParB-like chromosome segregation protein Spo0J
MKQNPLKEETLPAGIGKVLLSYLIPDSKNPRKDLKKGDPEFEKIQNSIGKFGQLDPIIYNTRTRKVIGGHQRLKVLDAKGYTELYTVTLGAYTWAFAEADLKELTDKEEIAANIALNKAQGDWAMDQLVLNLRELKTDGFDISITGFDDKEFNSMLRELHKDDEPLDSEPQISRAEELRKEWGTELGQLWQCGEHRVICGDCTDPAVVARVGEIGRAHV